MRTYIVSGKIIAVSGIYFIVYQYDNGYLDVRRRMETANELNIFALLPY